MAKYQYGSGIPTALREFLEYANPSRARCTLPLIRVQLGAGYSFVARTLSSWAFDKIPDSVKLIIK
ncbi:hypothetical protein K469DRAFT_706815 [Zopfia rhizophila CBS 207.26]|uniref:Uncharacterized protein n=1 Tax=Zopfia rhizophila CBS 207.26 TaxID=1314779 RepID=A0A6A6E566_9PEZI|nr:hypothetical protein K469DRAFT_706815 [Zopfia rhizophila CBS 207.26]